ncbi:hypothetical protein SAMN04487947_1194 [Halogeometricum rufum]|uniref:Winged helix-turn-helix DNA-binding n=2 Tax=Halogeometricum rufum TaxID=553469 RepID=A0A1I6GIB3_9EURY|nr:hypothetical protein SAMN04487947_1194 [Halogeometricum rufum]
MRQRADWMSYPADDTILELLRDYGNLTPSAIESLGGPSKSWAQNRLPVLARYGMVGRIHRGLYYISTLGVGYLDEHVDATELSERDEPLGPEDRPEFVYVTDNDE